MFPLLFSLIWVVMYIYVLRMIMQMLASMYPEQFLKIHRLNVDVYGDRAFIDVDVEMLRDRAYFAIVCTDGSFTIYANGESTVIDKGKVWMLIFSGRLTRSIEVATLTASSKGYVEIGVCLDSECSQRRAVVTKPFVLEVSVT